MTGQRIQQEAICYQWFKQRLILSVSKPNISQRSQIKEDTVEPSVPALEFNLKAYAAITWHNAPTSLGLEHRLADHRSHAGSAYRDATCIVPIAPPGQAKWRLLPLLLRLLLLILLEACCLLGLFTHKMMGWLLISSALSSSISDCKTYKVLRCCAIWRALLAVREKGDLRGFSMTARFHSTAAAG